MNSFVKVIKVDDPCKSAYEAIKAVINEDVKGKKVLLKPNVGFDGAAKSGLSTHPEVIRGIIKYLNDNNVSEVFVGDSSVIGVDTDKALKTAGIYDVCIEEGATCLDLNISGPIEKKIENGYVVDSILLSNILYDVDIVICVPVMKTHMYTGASLSIKNMKGGMYKREKNKLHRLTKEVPKGRSERALDFGILDLTTVLYPDYVVTDGVIGMEGFGPSGGTPKPFGYITSSSCPVSCDMISLKLMGLELEEVGHVKLVAESKNVTYDTIDVEPKDYIKYKEQFLTPAQARLSLNCENLEYVDESACSACHATLTQFLRYHSDKFKDSEKVTIFAGKDIDPEEIKACGKNAYLVGVCTAKYKDLAPYCKGCPPVTSEMLKMIWNMYGVTINAIGNSATNLQTMNYKIVINPYNGLNEDEIMKVSPSHIAVFDKKDLTIAKKVEAEVYSAFEGEKIVCEGFNNKIKTEFGYLTYYKSINTNTVGAIELDIEGMIFLYAYDEIDLNKINQNVESIILASNDISKDFITSLQNKFSIKLFTTLNFSTPILSLENSEVKNLSTGNNFTYTNQAGQAVSNAKVVTSGVM